MSDKLGSVRSHPVSLPEADIFTVRSLLFLLFLVMQTRTLTFSFSFISRSFFCCLCFFFFLPIPSPCVFVLFVSGIPSKEMNLFLFYLSVLLFLSHPFLCAFSLNLSLSYTFLHNDAATLCPSYPPFPLRTLLSSFSFPPSLLCSHSPRS